jgi:molybdopterin/thiamine biosynthesis adenylyltransferase
MVAMLTDDQLLRYSRHILLSQVDVAGQQAFAGARVLIIGLGGLGSPVAMYLAASGVGRLVLVDDDEVDLSNLQRQIIHKEARVGQQKVTSAAEAVSALNHHVQVDTIARRLDDAALAEQVQLADVVVDCSDNFTTRCAVNAACVRTKTPLVSGAAIRLDGQLAVFDSRRADSPCYQCLYDLTGEENLSCAESGVLAPLVGTIGSMQALEVLKLIGQFGEPLVGRLLLFDAGQTRWRELRLRRDPNCSVCGGSES